MFIDIICILVLAVAIVKGLSRGLIVAVFSFAAFIIGLAAALKLSAWLAVYIQEHTSLEGRWLPVLSFILLFIGVALLVRWIARLFRGMVSMALLGWVDKIGGILLYIFIYLMIFSLFLFFTTRLQLIPADTIATSKSYQYIEPWGPWVINGLGKLLPIFKDIFSDLQRFFENVGRPTRV